MPANTSGGFTQLGVLVSNTLLNYAFVVTVPSWVNEKKVGGEGGGCVHVVSVCCRMGSV